MWASKRRDRHGTGRVYLLALLLDAIFLLLTTCMLHRDGDVVGLARLYGLG
jgi:hypothetical protein